MLSKTPTSLPERLTFLSTFFFFLLLSSAVAARFDFRPFSPPGTGPDSRKAASRSGEGFLNVWTSEELMPRL